MAVLDRGQDLIEAALAIITADAEIVALAGRPTGIVVPWNDLAVDGLVPVIAYELLNGGRADFGAPIRTELFEIQYACFGRTKREANRLAARIPQLMTWAAFSARSLDVCLDPARAYRRFWPPHDPGPESPAQHRADVTVSLLVTT